MSHGKQVFMDYWTQMFLALLSKQRGPDTRKRKLEAKDLAMMAGPHLEPSCQSSGLEFLEVVPDTNDPLSGAAWIIQSRMHELIHHASSELRPSQADLLHPNLPDLVKGLLDRDLESHDLFLRTISERGRCLFTRRALADGEVALTPSFLLFTSEATLLEFLRKNDDESHASSIIYMSGILVNQSPRELYAVLFGAARCVKHYVGSGRKTPNVEWHLDTSQGPQRGCLDSLMNLCKGDLFSFL